MTGWARDVIEATRPRVREDSVGGDR